MDREKILVTGCAGFIGMHLCKALLTSGQYNVIGLDNLNNYYSVVLKKNRLNQLIAYKHFSFYKINISNKKKLDQIFNKYKPAMVVNLAAQAGVRYSLENPQAYIRSNLMGFMNVLECSRVYQAKGVVYASSSSVYGKNKKTPFSYDDNVDKPASIYAVSKRSNELMAYSYGHLYGLRTTGLRFFTVYGPWGRPDMAMYLFAENIRKNKPIKVFNKGNMQRDFTYIDDIVDGIISSIKKNYKYEIFNLGNNKCEDLMKVVSLIEKKLNRKAMIKYLGMQLGDVKKTYADIDYSKKMIGFKPKTKIEDGIDSFLNWFALYNRS